MVEDARRVAEKVGIEYRNVEATCRRAEEALFGKSSTEDHDLASEESPSTSASRRSPCGDAGSAEDRADSCPPGQSPSTSPAMASAGARSAEPRRSVKFEELLVAEDSAPSPPAAPTPTPSNGTTPSPPAATAATAAAVSQAGQWPALPAAQKACAPEAPGPWPALPGAQKVDPEADEDGIEHKPSIKNTFVHLREDDAKEADAGAQTCPILHGASWGGKRGSRSRAADAEQAARGTRGSASKCPEDSTKILEDLRTPDMFDATPNKFAWPYTHQGGGVFERTLREQAAETASRRSSLASRRSESQRGSLLQVEEGASTEGSSPDWFQPTPTPFVTDFQLLCA
ncbi:unnamed protein product [Prorocentrum cordatum]|uniref:Uncharacterized protein n=1 Tax=Prorocentrum cordatum TaxID=2364126 RepID=A0ABN9WJE9_9DINO|nr:unnamed protein product [Polarella glacialis]